MDAAAAGAPGPSHARPQVEDLDFLGAAEADGDPAVYERLVRLVDNKARYEANIADHREQIVHHINLEMYGKQIDKPDVYTKYLVAKCKVYFDTHGIHDEQAKLQLLDHALTEHVKFKIKREVPAFTRSIEDIRAANRYNLMSSGVRIHYPWYNFYRETKERIFQDPENAEAGYVVYEQPNFWKYGAIALLVAIGLWKGRHLISRLSSTLQVGTTIQSPEKVLEQLTSSVTSLNARLNTIDTELLRHSTTLNTWWFVRVFGAASDTLMESYRRLGNAFIRNT